MDYWDYWERWEVLSKSDGRVIGTVFDYRLYEKYSLGWLCFYNPKTGEVIY